MFSKEVEIKVKIGLKKSNKENFVKDLKKSMDDKIMPAVNNFMKRALFYKDIKPGDRRDLATFRSQNAGILTAAIMDAVDKSKVNLRSPKDTIVEIKNLDNRPGIEIEISLSTNDSASKVFEEKKFSTEDILEGVTHLSPSRVDRIFQDAAKKLKEQ